MKKSPLFRALFINLIFLLMIILFCDIKYEVSDDYMMDAVLSGAFGYSYNGYLLFSNVIYGHFLKLLYYITSNISWYFVMQLLICFVSLTSITYVILTRNNTFIGICLSILFVSFFSDDMYVLMQFTKTATVAICAGGVLFINGLWKDTKNIKMITIGGILLVIGSMVRFQCVYICAVFLLLIFIKEAFAHKSKELFKKKLISNLVICIIMFIVVLLFELSNIYIINSSNEYQQFRQTSITRSTVVDAPSCAYHQIADKLNEIGIDENDYAMIYSWDLVDRDIFTDDVLNKVAEIKNEHHKKSLSIQTLIKSFIARGYQDYIVVFGIFILFFIMLFTEPKKIPWMLFELLITACLVLYFFIRGRVLYRIEYSIFLCLGISLVCYFYTKANNNTQPISFIILSVLLCLFKLPLYNSDNSYKIMSQEQYSAYISDTFYRSYDFDIKKYRCDVTHRQPQGALLDYIESDSEHYYLMDFSSTIQIIYYNYKPYERIENGTWKNYSYLGSVTFGFPENNERWKEIGIDVDNPNKSLINENILIVDNKNIDVKLNYIRKYYYPNAEKELVNTIDGYNIWRFYIP